MSTVTPSIYANFGAHISTLRKMAGFSRQAELAKLVGATQQTISRWEAGTSRPRENQIPILAEILETDVEGLRIAAGYGSTKAIATFDKPFPVDALSPDSFERLCHYFLSKLYKDANVHRAGDSGHKQDGLDISATFSNGSRYTFQCKRVAEFGPQKVHTAVAQHTVKAEKKYLLLSRIASPQARAAADKHRNWDIWDREDISLRIRELPRDEQRQLVDVFFKGQRFALLGEIDDGPWETSTKFFDAFSREDSLFNHQWQLVGRDNELAKLATALRNKMTKLILLIGAGGSGKSRLLKKAVGEYETEQPTMLVRYLSRTANLTKKSFEELGNGKKLLVVDDAHDRNDLQLLFEIASTDPDNTTVVLAFRQYGLQHITAQASGYSLVGDLVSEVPLSSLNKSDAEQLAFQVLKKHSGPLHTAKDIARLTYDCPLATVVGAQVVAKDMRHPHLAQNEDEFRSTLFGRFEDVVAGDLGEKADAEAVKKLLRFIALVQPIHIEDDALIDAFKDVAQIAPHDTHRLLRVLIDAGILFKRGSQHRLSPDVLGDFLIEAQCVKAGGGSTGYAEHVFDRLPDVHIENLLLNLGKLDWRMADGKPSNSNLLNGVWGKLKPSQKYSDPHIRAVTSVAFYQPQKALNFAEGLIRDGKYSDQISELIKYAAYNHDYLQQASECLWALGKDDQRILNSHPSHPIRILSELCAPEPNKPHKYTETLLEFGINLISRDDAWISHHTPFDFLESILNTEGHTTSSVGHTISFEPFFVVPIKVERTRNKLVKVAINFLSDENPHKALRAAKCLSAALRYPTGTFGAHASSDIIKAWDKQFSSELDQILSAIKTNKIDLVVRLEISKAVSRFVSSEKGNPTIIAKQIVSLDTSNLECRTLEILIDGYGHRFMRSSLEKRKREWPKILQTLSTELNNEFPNAETLRAYIEDKLTYIKATGKTESISPLPLYQSLLKTSLNLAEATIEDALLRKDSLTSQFTADALALILSKDPVSGRCYITRILDTDNIALQAATGNAYASLNFQNGLYGDEDFAILRRLLGAEHEWVIMATVRALYPIAEWDQTVALKLLSDIAFRTNVIVDDTFSLFEFGDKLPFSVLSKKDVISLLDRIKSLPELDGYWIDKFLAHASEVFPRECAQFFMRRVEVASDTEDWTFRPCNHGPFSNEKLRFRQSTECDTLLYEVTKWMKEGGEKKGAFIYRARELFEAMFAPFDADIVHFFQEWLRTAQETDIRLIASILREAGPNFTFEQPAFVMSFLDRAEQFGREIHRMASTELYCSATSGIRSGTSGEPFPQDIKLKKDAENILSSIPRFSAAFELYDNLKKYADNAIHRANLEAEEFEE